MPNTTTTKTYHRLVGPDGLLTHEDDLNGKFIVRTEVKRHHPHGGKKYRHGFRTVNSLADLEHLCRNAGANVCHYEVIRGAQLQKPKFDIEYTADALGGEKPEAVFATIVEAIHLGFLVHYQTIPNLITCISTGTVERDGKKTTKHSYHLIAPDVCFQNNHEAREFTNEVFSHLPEHYQKHNFLDTSVNTDNRSFRLLHCQKPGSGRIKSLEDGSEATFADTLITYANDTETLPLIQWPIPVATKRSTAQKANRSKARIAPFNVPLRLIGHAVP